MNYHLSLWYWIYTWLINQVHEIKFGEIISSKVNRTRHDLVPYQRSWAAGGVSSKLIGMTKYILGIFFGII